RHRQLAQRAAAGATSPISRTERQSLLPATNPERSAPAHRRSAMLCRDPTGMPRYPLFLLARTGTPTNFSDGVSPYPLTAAQSATGLGQLGLTRATPCTE